VANQRFNLYSVFMVLPMGLVRSLANKELLIEDVEVEVNEDFANPDMAVNQFEMADEKGDEQANVATDNIIRINVAGLRLKHKAPWEQLLDMLMFWHPSKSGQDPDSGVRRVLQRSYTSMLRHCWLFMAWGLLIIVTNALGSQRLANISAPVSTFNSCNFINIRYLRVFFTVQPALAVVCRQELANANTVASVEAIRKELGPRYQLLNKEYQTMLYGAQAFPNETASHYTRVVGVLYAAGSGVDLLYRTRQCQNLVASNCFTPGHPLYEMSHRGTDLMMQTFFTAVETSIMSQDVEPSLDGDIFSTVWNMRGDTSGGLSNINKQYEASVLAVFDFVIAVHVVGLVLTLLLLLAYLAFVLKPYLKETANETKRLAELLTQLPNEVDVEGLLRASLLQLPPSNRNAKGSDADVKRPRGSLESPGGSRNLTSLDLAEGLKQT
ncbi:PAS domain-containing protein, partial [Haematococcus lacustris]